MKLNFICVTILLINFFASVVHAQTNAAGSKQCSQCYTSKTEICQKNCKSVSDPQGQQYCFNGCLKSACVTTCGAFGSPVKNKEDGESDNLPAMGPVSGGSAFKEHSGQCGRCLRRQEFGECRIRCSKDKVENVTSCRRKCAKGLCANKCSLPAKEVKRKEKRLTKEDCGDCKVRSRTYCYDRCGDNQDRPGYMSCHVSCVQERCSDICHPEPEGP
jgi:hypothetical protein